MRTLEPKAINFTFFWEVSLILIVIQSAIGLYLLNVQKWMKALKKEVMHINYNMPNRMSPWLTT